MHKNVTSLFSKEFEHSCPSLGTKMYITRHRMFGKCTKMYITQIRVHRMFGILKTSTICLIKVVYEVDALGT